MFFKKNPLPFLALPLIFFGGFLLTYAPPQLAFRVSAAAEAPGIPQLPDISQYTVENIAAQAPAYREGSVKIASMIGIPSLREFVKKNGRIQGQRLSQMRVEPSAIVVEEGDYDFTHLYEAVRAQMDTDAIQKVGFKYLLRLPILVGPQASLTISDKDAAEILLSTERGAFIANAGTLYILKTKITGWDEKNRKPAYFKKKTDFRPFIVAWSGARMYIAGSAVSSLGYRKGKAYGITYSSCPDCLKMNSSLPPPKGAVVGSTFSDLYFGFYSYEADGVAIVGNTYKNNIIYAIDPHDRSRHMIIANNETAGSKEKHGIIISREVNDSWIFGNNSHNNHGSGIMVDRNSVNNVIAYNMVHNNEQDGITFFESPENVTWKNKITKNKKSGVRIRNSWDINLYLDEIQKNSGSSIEVYSDDISVKNDRDLKVDPFTEKASANVYGSKIVSSSAAPVFKITDNGTMDLSHLDVRSSAPFFAGDSEGNESRLMRGIKARMVSVTAMKETNLAKKWIPNIRPAEDTIED